MNTYISPKHAIKNIIKVITFYIYGVEAELDEIDVWMNEDRKNGDYTSNFAFKLAKKLGRSPMEIAQEIVDVINILIKIEEELAKNGQNSNKNKNNGTSLA